MFQYIYYIQSVTATERLKARPVMLGIVILGSIPGQGLGYMRNVKAIIV